MKKFLNVGLIGLVIVLVALGGLFAYYNSKLAPLPSAKKQFVRFNNRTNVEAAGQKLVEKGIIRDAKMLNYYTIFNRKPRLVGAGTYQLNAGMTAAQVIAALQKPVSNLFRIPETNLSFRTANLLEKNEIATAADYNAFIKAPSRFLSVTKVDLPADSLEGYLYPDTYDLPPLIGAAEVIEKQLKAFETKIYPLLPDPVKRKKILTIASMVELEAGVDEERSKIAGVIYNRLSKNMRLEIDATVLYALQEWRRLYFKDYRNTNSPYNTYKIKGLPPGPICSPSLKSVQAALNPARHNYLYYVALPNRTHLFSPDYPGHLKNIQIARKARDQATSKPAASSNN
jgi:UPF0755 protein